DLGRNRAEASRAQTLLVRRSRGLRCGLLPRIERVDCRAVLRSDIVALTHALSRIVVLPEYAEQLLVADLFRIVDDEDDLAVPRHPGASLLVSRVRGHAARITDRRRIDPRRAPELALGAPETTHAEHRA